MLIANSTGLQTADGAIGKAGMLYLTGVVLIPAAADSTLKIYNGADATGILLLSIAAAANAAPNVQMLNIPVVGNLGLYADVSGASAGYIVHYLQG